MKIEHIAVWVSDLGKMKDFYVSYFNGTANHLYSNPIKKYSSYFISFETGCRLELMHRADVVERPASGEYLGIAHLAFSVGDKSEVDKLTERLRQDDFQIVSGPRTTGDGYYESVVLDPEGNRIEITA